MRQQSVPLAVLLTAMLAACSSVTEEQTGSSDVPTARAAKNPVENLAPEQRDIVTLAIDALAADLGIAKDRITLDTVRAVDWPDSSVGCPQPGQAYLDVITPGHKVTLRVDPQVHVVHEARGRAFVCHRTKPYAGINPQRELVFSPQMIAAQEDLAGRLGVPKEDIKPWSAEEKTWNDAGLGCPEPGVMYAQAQVTGWVLTLRNGTRNYTYHTDMQRTIPCPAISDE